MRSCQSGVPLIDGFKELVASTVVPVFGWQAVQTPGLQGAFFLPKPGQAMRFVALRLPDDLCVARGVVHFSRSSKGGGSVRTLLFWGRCEEAGQCLRESTLVLLVLSLIGVSFFQLYFDVVAA